MREPLVIGSRNIGKAGELADLLEDPSWQVKSLAEFPEIPEPAEDGATFEENAVQKATYYAEHIGVWCVADDSGLVVDALDGAPGVYSARYAGPDCVDANNIARLLAELADVAEPERTARFVCCAAAAPPGGAAHVEVGAVEGRIAMTPRGVSGFGYDPVFVPEGYSRTFAEMTLSEKQAISHRGRALRKLRDYLTSLR